MVVTAERIQPLQDIAAQVPDRVALHRMNVTDPQQVAAAVRASQERFSGIDVMVNTAGYGIMGAVEETPELRALMKTDVFGAFTITQAALPMMRKRRKGEVVMIW